MAGEGTGQARRECSRFTTTYARLREGEDVLFLRPMTFPHVFNLKINKTKSEISRGKQ